MFRCVIPRISPGIYSPTSGCDRPPLLSDPGGGGGTWPMFGYRAYRGAAESLKSWSCLGHKFSKNPTLCRTTVSISRPCLGRDKIHALWFYRKIRKRNAPLVVHRSIACSFNLTSRRLRKERDSSQSGFKALDSKYYILFRTADPV